MAEVEVPRELFQKILRLIDDLRPKPAPRRVLNVRMRHHEWEECIGMKNGQIGGSDVLPAVFRALFHSLHIILCYAYRKA